MKVLGPGVETGAQAPSIHHCVFLSAVSTAWAFTETNVQFSLPALLSLSPSHRGTKVARLRD